MSLNLRTIRIPTLMASACLALGMLGATVSLANGAITPRATHVCDIPDGLQYPSETQTYVELRVTNVSCAYGAKFLKPLWRCRTANGKSVKGQCKRKVQGFSCTEAKRHYSEVNGKQDSFAVRTTCRRGIQRMVIAYSQSLNGTT